MMHLCFICSQQMQEMDLTGAEEELFTLLSPWNPARVQEGALHLPDGWSACRQDQTPLACIPLDKEANYTLKNDEHTAMLMVRSGGAEVITTSELLATERFSVGRSRRNEICYRDGYISTSHGVFSFDSEGALWYSDNSTNGTFINGKLLCGEKQQLQSGDQLCFPPLMSIVVNGCVLTVRRPAEHSQLNLPLREADDNIRNVALYMQAMGRMFHLRVPRDASTLEAFMACALAQVDEHAQGYLAQPVVLYDPENQTPITSDALLAGVLDKMAPVLLAV